MDEGLVGYLLHSVVDILIGGNIVDQYVLFVQQVALDHVVRNLKREHWILSRVQFINVNDPQQDKLPVESDFNFKSPFL